MNSCVGRTVPPFETHALAVTLPRPEVVPVIAIVRPSKDGNSLTKSGNHFVLKSGCEYVRPMNVWWILVATKLFRK
jgi:hypothetical protein